MSRSSRSIASTIATETGRMLKSGHDRFDLFPIMNFFDAYREKLIRALLPKLKPDRKGRLVAIVGSPNCSRLKLINIYVDRDFRRWSADDGSYGKDAYSLVGWLLGADAPSLILAAATAKILSSRLRRADIAAATMEAPDA